MLDALSVAGVSGGEVGSVVGEGFRGLPEGVNSIALALKADIGYVIKCMNCE